MARVASQSHYTLRELLRLLIEQAGLVFINRNVICVIDFVVLEIISPGYSQDIAPVSNIPQCAELSILGVTFQQNCKYSSHVRAKVSKANKSLFVLGSLRKEGMPQEEVDHLFNAIVTLCRFMVPQIPTFL